MKKLLLPLLAFLLCIVPTRAQTRTTSVSIAVADTPDAQAWANGTYTTALAASPGSSNGTSSPGPAGALDASGNATFILTRQNDISLPTGGQWQVTVCPQMGVPLHPTASSSLESSAAVLLTYAAIVRSR
jgi:hypothetical protein